ncbi:MAG: YraN family protein [Bauldia sp.]|nr:YraN family protein [Bauldia sp.]
MSVDATEARKRSERHGHRAERLAAWFLRLKGYRVIARRWRTGAGEIDLVVKRGQVLAFVEVKARADLVAGLEAVTPAARTRIARAGAAWVSRYPAAGLLTLRYDIVVIRRRKWPVHVPNAFDAMGRL